MLPEQMGTIKVQLKCRLQYKSSALSLNIRPHKVQPANWLASNSRLYQEQRIAFNPNWEINSDNNNESIEQTDDIKSGSDSQNSSRGNILADENDEFSEDAVC